MKALLIIFALFQESYTHISYVYPDVAACKREAPAIVSSVRTMPFPNLGIPARVEHLCVRIPRQESS